LVAKGVRRTDMREIEFRGKRKDTGERVYGNPVVSRYYDICENRDRDLDFRSHNAGYHQIICATEAGPPPDDWEPK
jgi:hypothetical protein